MKKIDLSWGGLHRALCIMVLACSGSVWAADPPKATPEAAGIVLAVSGKADIIRGKETKAVSNRAELFSGDTLMTGEGQVQVRFTDGTMLTLYRDTRFVVEDFQFNKGKSDRAQFSLLNGLMHTVTGKMEKDNYKVKTRLANLGVRGTEYSAQLGTALQVSVDQGKVEIANAGGSILVGAGSSAIVTGANEIPRPTALKIDLRGAGGPGGRTGQGGGPGAGPGAGGPGASGPGAGGGAGGGAAPPPPPPPPGTQKIS